ncbi:hypothetical protein GS629_03660 [Aeromonas veronii]|uniref:hypothetical protein n=1 Tax=Aeromonas veronii TaxID=654 RepID=UPI001320A7CF|nr:hypothetical protein [Aeromonas veronii]MXV27846.1 hypothetical protein [Aeromonas veronii]
MTIDVKGKAEKILKDSSAIEQFAKKNNITYEAAKAVFEGLAEKPEIPPEVKEYIHSKERSEDFKGYTAGEETGYKRGHEAGFAKGAALSAIALVGLAITFVLKNK